jgi:hypothetical protein
MGKNVNTVEDVRSAVLERIPVGSPVDVAKRAMEADGFACSHTVGGSWGDVRNVDYLYCDRIDGPPPVKQRWQIALVEQNARVTDVRVSGGLIGP